MTDEYDAGHGELGTAASVHDALDGFLRQSALAGTVDARHALGALAYAQAPGFTVGLWAMAIEAIRGEVIDSTSLGQFARSAVDSDIVTVADGTDPSYRLADQAMSDALVEGRPAGRDHAVLTAAFLAHGRAEGWGQVPLYLLCSLPHHADQAGVVFELLDDYDSPPRRPRSTEGTCAAH